MALTLGHLAAFCEPCYCDKCEGADKLLGEPCAFCTESRWGCRNLPCWCIIPQSSRCACGEELMAGSEETCWNCWLTDFYKRYDAAVLIQALVRGHKARKDLKERKAEEIRAYTPIWRFYDDQYRMYTYCQTLMVNLKKDDPEWDATKTPFYTWMMENGPSLEECETFLRLRGWVRPKRTSFPKTDVFRHMIQIVLDSCGVTGDAAGTALAVFDTFVKKR
jgi:hypothetical protein